MQKPNFTCVPKIAKSGLTAGCRSDVHEICRPLGYYAVYSGNTLPTFRDKLSVQY